MKNGWCAGFAIRVALFYFTIAWVCQAIRAQSETRFELVHNTLIVVSLMAGNEGPFDFVLDTGADTSIVDPLIAPRLLAPSTDRVQQTTLAGVQALTRGSLRSLSLGAAEVKNLEVLVQDLSELRKMDPLIEGIAGQNFLSHFNYLIDYHRRAMRIEEHREIRDAIEGDPIAIEAVENRMMIAAEAKGRNQATLRLLLDSGANSVVLLRRAARELNLPSHGGGMELTSSGAVGLKVGQIEQLALGSQHFHGVAAALPIVDPAERIGDGLLPTALFQSFYVNNREGFVIVNPRGKKN
jgi:predicted aspartyl protease